MTDRKGIAVVCTTCHRRKKPCGRSAPLEMANGLCDMDSCAGYDADPLPDSLWPGELKSEFGINCSDHATEEVTDD